MDITKIKIVNAVLTPPATITEEALPICSITAIAEQIPNKLIVQL